MRVLVVEGSRLLNERLTTALRYDGWDALAAADGRSAAAALRTFTPDLLVTATRLAEGDGVVLHRRLRADVPGLAVLFLAAHGSPTWKLSGLTAGSSDYVVKPFSFEEVLARLRALLRGAGVVAPTESRLVVGDLTLDEVSREVQRAGQVITLTRTEFGLLRFFMRNPNLVLSRAQILDRVWPYDFRGPTNVVALYVSYLRRKVDAGRSPLLLTVRGAGYVLRTSRG